MPTLPFTWVDAFTREKFKGNPCAVFFDADYLDASTMQTIAFEMNLSESAFVMKSAVADFRARYFTPAEEIPLAGHPTISTIFALWDSQRLTIDADYTQITLELNVGVLPIELFAHEGKLTRIVMTQKQPQFLATYRPEEVMPCFGLSVADALPNYPIQTVSTGTPQLMVPVKDHEALRRASLNIERYNALRSRADFFSPHLFCVAGVTSEGATFARHFGTPPDTIEDAVTGSATGGMGAYVWRYGLVDSPQFLAQQGHWMGRAGEVHVEVVGARDAIETVKIGGSAVVVLRGELLL